MSEGWIGFLVVVYFAAILLTDSLLVAVVPWAVVLIVVNIREAWNKAHAPKKTEPWQEPDWYDRNPWAKQGSNT